MLYLEHCIISINNSNFQIYSKKYFLPFYSFENIMESETFAPQEQMFNFSKYFKKSYISQTSKGACVE